MLLSIARTHRPIPHATASLADEHLPPPLIDIEGEVRLGEGLLHLANAHVSPTLVGGARFAWSAHAVILPRDEFLFNRH